MIFKRVELVRNKENVWLDCYVADKIQAYKRKAILVIPGGGYGCVCSDREGEPIAHAFMAHGFNAFVLHYSVGADHRFPEQLIEASLAMKYIREHSEEYGIDEAKVFVTGFSAGGHLCSALGTQWHLPEVNEAVGMPYGCNRPDGIVPVYPVISSDLAIRQKESFNNLCGRDMPEDAYLKCSLERFVDERSSPAFIVHTANDQIVNVGNSIAFAAAYAEHKIPFELHIFEDAPHGMALGNKITAAGNPKYDNPHNAHWVELAAEWTDNVR